MAPELVAEAKGSEVSRSEDFEALCTKRRSCVFRAM